MFLTRLPVPRFTDHAPEYLQQSTRYFPLIGWIVGGISAGFFLFCYQFLSLELSVLASIFAGILTTGAFHEDGFADVCDAFGGGWTKEKILEIMKDSRLGTFGTIGLIGILGAKFLLLRDLILLLQPSSANVSLLIVFSLVAAHSISRFMSVVSIQFYPYVTPDDTSKAKPSAAKKLSPSSLVVAFLFAIVFFALLPPVFFGIIPLLLVATVLLNRYFSKWIGGHTGDCLGTVQQITELLCYLTMILLWKYT